LGDKFIIAGYLDGYLLLIDTNDVQNFKKVLVTSDLKKVEENLDPGNTVI
jgi:hypothetical protein